MTKNQNAVMIAGIRGGCGKSTVTLAIISALRKSHHLKVIPFKKGPDYIDASWLALAAHNPCYNLDPFLLIPETLLTSYCAHSTGDISVIEGNRGLHDGKDIEGTCSTASVAKLLKVPVILVVDATKVTRTASAMVLGCILLDKEVDLKAVIINQVSSSRHEKIITQSIEKYCGIQVIGALPRLDDILMPQRHMGLTPTHEYEEAEAYLEGLSLVADKYIDTKAVRELSKTAKTLQYEPLSLFEDTTKPSRPRKIGVFIDRAFQFYYTENLNALTQAGGTLIPINALKDPVLPDIDILYIGGGFPETNAVELSANASLLKSLRQRVDDGLPVYAECGGFMFLGREIMVGGKRYPMANILPFSFEMQSKPHAHGYTEAEVISVNPFYPKGLRIRGHEFHYSKPIALKPINELDFAFAMLRGKGIADGKDGVCFKNVFATYSHVHAYGCKEWITAMMEAK